MDKVPVQPLVANPQGFYAMVTLTLITFFEKTKERAGPVNGPMLVIAISDLLMGRSTISVFFTIIEWLIGATLPKEKKIVFISELQRCVLQKNPADLYNCVLADDPVIDAYAMDNVPAVPHVAHVMVTQGLQDWFDKMTIAVVPAKNPIMKKVICDLLRGQITVATFFSISTWLLGAPPPGHIKAKVIFELRRCILPKNPADLYDGLATGDLGNDVSANDLANNIYNMHL